MVDAGSADIAAIDCVTYALLSKYRPRVVQNLRILCQTAAVPAPPYVTSRLVPESVHTALRESLLRVLNDPSTANLRQALLLDHVDILPTSAYNAIARLEHQAVRLGYREMPFFVK